MTERKPASLSYESWVDKQVREAAERGEFDDLPGAGKPLPGLHEPDDEMWWIKQKIRREGLSAEALLPTSIQLRKELDRLPEEVRELPTERVVREVVARLNRRIAEALRAPADGLRVRLRPVDVEDAVRWWHDARRTTMSTSTGTSGNDRSPSARSRWWHRLLPGRRPVS